MQRRKATFGGVIEATFENRRSMQYGMTAGHAPEELLSSPNRTDSRDMDHAGDSIDDGFWGSSVETSYYSEKTTLGNILNNNKLPGVLAGARPSHDWALFGLDSPKPNVVCNLEQGEERPLIIASRPAFSDNLCDPVIMMGVLRA
jgi:hypothetical protein